MKKLMVIVILATSAFACNKKSDLADAYGNFEVEETVISAQVPGKIIYFDISEGMELNIDDYIACIDTTELQISKEQLYAQMEDIKAKSAPIITQVNVIKAQIDVLNIEKQRVENLLAEDAATQKQLDDINGQISILEKQIENVQAQNSSVFTSLELIETSIKSVDNKIQNAIVNNPINGVVLQTYAKQYEVVNAGKPLYSIADLSELTLRAYISETQLDDIKIGQTVNVFTDSDEDIMKQHEGIVTWIASEAEFTPKIIQTKEERVNLVYAIKVVVKNNGELKIGMPAEIRF